MSSERKEPLVNPAVESDTVGKSELSAVELDAVEPTQAGLGLEPQRVQEQGNVEEGSIQAASGAAGLGLESHSFQEQLNVKEVARKANSRVSVLPTQADLQLESDSFKERPHFEEGAIQANSEVAGQPPLAGFRLESQNFQERPHVDYGAIQANHGIAVQPTQAGLEQSNVGKRLIQASAGIVVQPTQAALPNLSNIEGISMDDFHDLLHPSVDEPALLEEIFHIATGQVEHSHQEEEAGINDRNVAQSCPSNLGSAEILQIAAGQADKASHHKEEEAGINDRNLPQALPSDLVGTSHEEEEEAGINNRNVLQALPSDLDNLRTVGWIELADLEEPIDGEEDNGSETETESQQMQNCEEDTGIQARTSNQYTQDGPPQQGLAGGEEAGINDRNLPQALPSNLDNFRSVGWIELADLEQPIDGEEDNGSEAQTEGQQMQNSEEDTGIQARTGGQQTQDGLPQQGTAGHRMRLQVSSLHSATGCKGSISGFQHSNASSSCIGRSCATFPKVPLCGAKGPIESNCASIVSNERTCMCDGLSLEQEAMTTCSLSHALTTKQSILNVTCQLDPPELLQTEPADLLYGVATCSSARVTTGEENDTKGPFCTDGSCVTKLDHPNVAQQTPSGSSSTSPVHLLLGLLLGDACVLPVFAVKLPDEMDELNFGSKDSFSGSMCSETDLEGRRSMAFHRNKARPYLQQMKMATSSVEEGEITKMQHEHVQAVSNEERRQPRTGQGPSGLFWIATLSPILLSLFCRFFRLTRVAFTSVQEKGH